MADLPISVRSSQEMNGKKKLEKKIHLENSWMKTKKNMNLLISLNETQAAFSRRFWFVKPLRVSSVRRVKISLSLSRLRANEKEFFSSKIKENLHILAKIFPQIKFLRCHDYIIRAESKAEKKETVDTNANCKNENVSLHFTWFCVGKIQESIAFDDPNHSDSHLMH